MSENGGGAPDTEASHLLVLTHSRPAEALARARALLSRRPPISAAEASMARQAAGLALRDLGHLEEGLTELRRALRTARASGQAQREADVRASLGLTMANAGHTARGMAHLDAAVSAARGGLTGRVLMRRAAALGYIGRRDDALRDQNQVVAILHRHGDFLWEARARSHRGLILLELGQTRRADADFLQRRAALQAGRAGMGIRHCQAQPRAGRSRLRACAGSARTARRG